MKQADVAGVVFYTFGTIIMKIVFGAEEARRNLIRKKKG